MFSQVQSLLLVTFFVSFVVKYGYLFMMENFYNPLLICRLYNYPNYATSTSLLLPN